MKFSKISEVGTRTIATPVRSHTRGQNDMATKHSVSELADEVKDFGAVITCLFAAMGQKEKVDKRWVGFHEAWIKANGKKGTHSNMWR